MGTINKDTVKEFRETLLAFRLKASLAAGSLENWAKYAKEGGVAEGICTISS
jgi:hypothetical protein